MMERSIIRRIKRNLPNIMINLLKESKGAALFTVLLLMIISTVLGGALVVSYNAVSRTTEIERYRTQALYLADAGINRALRNIKNGNNTTPINDTITFTGYNYTGSFIVNFTINNTTQQINLTSTGEVPINRTRSAIRTVNVLANSTTYRIIAYNETTKMR